MRAQQINDTSSQDIRLNIQEGILKNITKLILKRWNPEKIICFGSTTTAIRSFSCFEQEERKTVSSKSDCYYILLIPETSESQADGIIQQRMEQYLKTIADVVIIVHRMDEINLALKNGSSFFSSIYKKGAILYDKKNVPFIAPANGMDICKRVSKREKFWNQWRELSADFLSGARFYAETNKNNLAVFMLHQTLQHCYSGMLRVLIGYRTNSNGLGRLVRLIESVLPNTSFFPPSATPEDTRLAQLLLKGFSDARYDNKLEITSEEVSTLITRIGQILQAADLACLKRLSSIRQGSILDTN